MLLWLYFIGIASDAGVPHIFTTVPFCVFVIIWTARKWDKLKVRFGKGSPKQSKTQ